MDEPRGHPEAILRPSEAEQTLTVDRVPASAPLADLVDYHWYVGWRAPEPHRQQVVPQPRIHLAAEDGRLLVHGISREPFFRTLTGTGHTIGAAFHPGGFRPFLGRGVGGISGAVVPAGDLLGVDDRPVASYVLGDVTVPEMVSALEEYLLLLDPRPDPVVAEVRALVDAAEHDRGITRAEQLADRASTSLRSLQRLFTDYVGIGPKWVISRFRILDAAAAAHSGEPVDWSTLATDLGFTDQAHLTRAFTSVVGTPPATYQRHA
jgi:AraC-like DNA-binding protein